MVEIQLSGGFDIASDVQNTEVIYRGNLSKKVEEHAKKNWTLVCFNDQSRTHFIE